MAKNSIKWFVLLLLSSVIFTACGKEDVPQKDEAFKNAKSNVKHSEFSKNGVLYRSYDFGKAIFTVDSPSLLNHTESTIDAYWFWPGLTPWNGNSGADMSKYSVVRVRANFSEFGRDKDPYENWQKSLTRNDMYKPTEVESDFVGLRKFVAKSSNIIYMPKNESIKSPQGTPLVFWCYEEKHPKLTCEIVFQYFNQVSVHAEFSGGEVLPEWQEFVTKINTFFESRMQEK